MSSTTFIEGQIDNVGKTPRDCGRGEQFHRTTPHDRSRGAFYRPDIISKRGGRARRLNVAILTLLAILLLGLLWWFDPAEANLPLCTFHALTGFDCPGCGATRATHELLHGRLLAAWHYNALWVLLLPLAGYVAVSELLVAFGRRPLPGDEPRRAWFWIAVSVAGMVFFVLRNLPNP